MLIYAHHTPLKNKQQIASHTIHQQFLGNRFFNEFRIPNPVASSIHIARCREEGYRKRISIFSISQYSIQFLRLSACCWDYLVAQQCRLAWINYKFLIGDVRPREQSAVKCEERKNQLTCWLNTLTSERAAHKFNLLQSAAWRAQYPVQARSEEFLELREIRTERFDKWVKSVTLRRAMRTNMSWIPSDWNLETLFSSYFIFEKVAGSYSSVGWSRASKMMNEKIHFRGLRPPKSH